MWNEKKEKRKPFTVRFLPGYWVLGWALVFFKIVYTIPEARNRDDTSLTRLDELMWNELIMTGEKSLTGKGRLQWLS